MLLHKMPEFGAGRFCDIGRLLPIVAPLGPPADGGLELSGGVCVLWRVCYFRRQQLAVAAAAALFGTAAKSRAKFAHFAGKRRRG